MPSLAVDLREVGSTLDGLIDLYRNTGKIETKYRMLVAEIILLRSFYVLENAFLAISSKAVCGSLYLDGSAPVLLHPCKTMASAVHHMQTLGRQRYHDLKWTKTTEIKENLKHVMDPTDHMIVTFDAHGIFIDELRRVRNRIAHNNKSSRKAFRVVVRRHYGAELNSVSPGKLLISTRRSPPLIEAYLLRMRILIKTLVKG